MANQMQEQLMALFAQNLQQQRLIWQLVRKLGGKTEINQTEVSPLWALGYKSIAEEGKIIEVRAEELAELSEDQVGRIITFLKGTSKSIKDAMDDQGLDLYPTHYVQNRISHAIIWFNERWMDYAPPDFSKN